MSDSRDRHSEEGTVRLAIRSAHAEHVTITVPDDGTFRIPNSKEHLSAFLKNVPKEMGKGIGPLSTPKTMATNAPAIPSLV